MSEWIAVGALGTIATAIASLYRWVLKPYLEHRNKKRQEEKQKLNEIINKLRICINSIDWNVKHLVKTDQFEGYTASLDFPEISPDIGKKIQDWIKNFQRLRDWREACKESIILEIERLVKLYLLETQSKYDLISILAGDEFVIDLIKGDRIDRHWIETKYPSIYKAIEENLKEPWITFNNFCIYLNRDIANNRMRKRYQMEKNELIELGEKITQELELRISEKEKLVK